MFANFFLGQITSVMDVTQKGSYFGETIHFLKTAFQCLMQNVWYPCNVGVLAENKNSNFENIYIFVLICMRRYQCYGCDTSEMYILLNNLLPNHNTCVVIWNGSECQLTFQDGRQIALISMVMGLMGHFPVSLHFIRFLNGHNQYLGYNTFSWEVSTFIFSCSGWHYCGISQIKNHVWLDENAKCTTMSHRQPWNVYLW